MATGSGTTRKAQLLTAKGIEAMKPDSNGAYRVPDTRAKGLALRVAADGGKTGDLVHRIKGKGVRRLSLGRYEDVGLEAMRRRANELTSAGRQGRDLIAEEEAALDQHKQSFTVAQVVDEYLKREIKGRLRTAREIEHRLRRALKPVMNRKASDIKRRNLRELLDATADQGLVREPAHRKQAIGAMFRWAVAQDIIESNPTEGLSSYGASAPRDRVLSNDEIRVLWQWLDDTRNIPRKVSDILKLQLCLGARCGEISGMRTSEFATDHKGRLLWTLPPERSKNKKARVTPILGLAMNILAPLVDKDILFENETGAPLYTSLVDQHLRLRRDRFPIPKFTTHDLRRSVATAMVAQLKLPLELVATAVGHTAGGSQTNTLVRHYVHDDFVDSKASALGRWDRRLRQILSGEAAGKVIPLRA
jgi:integrase